MYRFSGAEPVVWPQSSGLEISKAARPAGEAAVVFATKSWLGIVARAVAAARMATLADARSRDRRRITAVPEMRVEGAGVRTAFTGRRKRW
jgi:hypothetical protein